MRSSTLDAQLRMTLTAGLGPKHISRLEEAFDTPTDIVNASIAELKMVGISPNLAQKIRKGLDEADVDREYQLIEKHNVNIITLNDDNYPPLLKYIHDPPPLLFVRGTIQPTDAVALAIVGSRRCTTYGREQADRLAAAAAQAGLTIISGGARGIDSYAHHSAIRVGGRTVVIMGCGLANCYPPENAELFNTIAQNNGAIISELPMTSPPIASNFPPRNRIISGMSLGILVIEAANRSGALITARLAAEEHHREVMALPGRVDSPASAGCHRMIREGWSALVTNIIDILDQLGETGHTLQTAIAKPDSDDQPASLFNPTDDKDTNSHSTIDRAGMSDDQCKLFDAITTEPISIDVLIRQTNLPVAVVQSSLMKFQLQGIVQRIGGNQVKRRRH